MCSQYKPPVGRRNLVAALISPIVAFTGITTCEIRHVTLGTSRPSNLFPKGQPLIRISVDADVSSVTKDNRGIGTYRLSIALGAATEDSGAAAIAQCTGLITALDLDASPLYALRANKEATDADVISTLVKILKTAEGLVCQCEIEEWNPGQYSVRTLALDFASTSPVALASEDRGDPQNEDSSVPSRQDE